MGNVIKLKDDLRVSFQYEIQRLATNGTVPLTIVRVGKELPINLPVSANFPRLIPSLNGAYPSYFIYGPLVFSTATDEYLDGYVQSKFANSFLTSAINNANPLVTRKSDEPSFPDEGIVLVVAPFFPHKLANGYSSPLANVVKRINGIRVKNLNHLVEILRDAKNEFITIEFDARHTETLVFARAEMLAATEEILTDNGVRAQGSPDTLAVWNNKSAN